MNKAKFIKNVTDEELYRQNNVVRYNSTETIKHQNIGEHHAIVAQLTIKIIEELVAEGYYLEERTKYLALAGAAIHDLGEIKFGDMNYILKTQYSELSSLSNRIEHEYIENIRGYKDVFTEARYDGLANNIYKMADALDLVLFVRREQQLGNNNPALAEIEKNGNKLAMERLTNILALLSPEGMRARYTTIS